MFSYLLGLYGSFRRFLGYPDPAVIKLSETDEDLRKYQEAINKAFRSLPSTYRPSHVYRDPISRTVLVCVLENFKLSRSANLKYSSYVPFTHVPLDLSDDHGVLDPDGSGQRIYAVLRDVPWF